MITLDLDIKFHDYEFSKLKGDASSRDYYRICRKNEPGDKSKIFMDLSKSEQNTGIYFLNTHTLFNTNKIPVPQILEHDDELSWFALEDLGDLTLYDQIMKTGAIPSKTYFELIDIIVKIQSVKPPEASEKFDPLSRKFDTAKFKIELQFFLEHYVKKFLRKKISEQDEIIILEEFNKISEIICTYPQVPAHRDFHSKNIMIKNQKPYVIDFQDARQGPPQYDLVSLLFDSYIKLDENLREDLRAYYVEKYSKIEPSFNNDEFNRIFTYTALQRNLKAIGTFASQYNIRNNSSYLKFIKPTLSYIDLHFKLCNELENLKNILTKYLN